MPIGTNRNSQEKLGRMERILVTGGAGYIGSHTCKALAVEGYEPVVLDNFVHGHEWAVQWGPVVRSDISDAPSVIAAINQYRPAAVIHFAAFAYVGESVNDPLKYYQNNVAGTLGLLDAMIQTGMNRLIFSSSCATYGIPGDRVIPESQEQNPINPYGRSKLMVEQILRDFDTAYGLKSTSLRYFNAAGADSDGELGEAHDPETHLVPLILDAAMGRREAITIFGTDYDTPDGTCVRDYVHVSDLAEAHVLALKRLLRSPTTEAFNLGVGHGYSVREVVDISKIVTGARIRVIEGERRSGDPSYLVAESDRAMRELGWGLKHSTLEQIVETAWAWHRKYHATGTTR